MVAPSKNFQNFIDLQDKVLNIIKELLKKRKVFQFDTTFIDFCQKKLKTSDMEVYKAIYSLIHRKIIVPGSALTRDHILKNPSRASIYKMIQNQPGVHIRQLCALLDIDSMIIRVHIEILVKFNFIRTKIYTKLVLLFPSEFPETYDDFFYITKNENDRKIVHYLLNQQLTLSELSTQLGLHHSTVQYHLKKLEQLNLIYQIQANYSNRYTINSAKLDDLNEFIKKYPQ